MTCQSCGRPIEDAKFYVLSFGALLSEGDGRARMADSDELPAKTFLSLGVHDHGLCGGVHAGGAFSVDLEEEVPAMSNQHEACFCSKECLKTWFCERVDRLLDLT